MHEPVVFAVNGCPTGTCRSGVLHSSGRAVPSSSDRGASSGEGPDSRGGALDNVQGAAGGKSGGSADGASTAGVVNIPGEAADCGVRSEKTLQVNVNAGPGGRIDIKSRSWMDGLRARMRERDSL